MARQFTDWNLIWRFLKLDNLLINKLRLFMNHKIGVQRTLFSRIAGSSLTTTLPWQGGPSKATQNGDNRVVHTIAALNV
jgi:hypothetical protein